MYYHGFSCPAYALRSLTETQSQHFGKLVNMNMLLSSILDVNKYGPTLSSETSGYRGRAPRHMQDCHSTGCSRLAPTAVSPGHGLCRVQWGGEETREPRVSLGRLSGARYGCSGPYGLTADSEQNIKLLSRPAYSSIQTITIHYPSTL